MGTIKKIVKVLLLVVHFGAGAFTLFCYLFLLRKDYFIDITEKPFLIFFGSGIVMYLLFYLKPVPGWQRKYFGILTILTLGYIGLWTVLGLVMMHSH